MTGFSIPRNMNDLKRLTPYYKKLISMVLIVSGSALMLEHLFEYGGFDLLDFAGHEYYGLALIGVGFLLSMKWSQWKTLGLKDIRKWIR